MTRIVVCGCNGKMGRVVIDTVSQFEGCKVVAGVDISGKQIYDFPVFRTPDEIDVPTDAVIDFSNPAVLSSLLKYASINSVPLVLCTTGFSSAQVRSIKNASESVPIFYSGNMSVGINLIISLAKKAAEVLGEKFDIEIIEKHHNQKIDAPSGTALMIADGLSPHVNGGDPVYVYDRHSYRRSRESNEIGIHSIRGGSIVGDHEVLFAGRSETVTISHHAQSRQVFAEGAVKAAIFIKDKPSGMYDMENLLSKS